MKVQIFLLTCLYLAVGTESQFSQGNLYGNLIPGNYLITSYYDATVLNHDTAISAPPKIEGKGYELGKVRAETWSEKETQLWKVEKENNHRRETPYQLYSVKTLGPMESYNNFEKIKVQAFAGEHMYVFIPLTDGSYMINSNGYTYDDDKDKCLTLYDINKEILFAKCDLNNVKQRWIFTKFA